MITFKYTLTRLKDSDCNKGLEILKKYRYPKRPCVREMSICFRMHAGESGPAVIASPIRFSLVSWVMRQKERALSFYLSLSLPLHRRPRLPSPRPFWCKSTRWSWRDEAQTDRGAHMWELGRKRGEERGRERERGGGGRRASTSFFPSLFWIWTWWKVKCEISEYESTSQVCLPSHFLSPLSFCLPLSHLHSMSCHELSSFLSICCTRRKCLIT